MLEVSEEGSLKSVCDQMVFGNIKCLKVLRWHTGLCKQIEKNHVRFANLLNQYYQLDEEDAQLKELVFGKDLLIATSNSGFLSFIVYSDEERRFISIARQKIASPGFSYKSHGAHLAVDPLSRSIAVAAFEDSICLYQTSNYLKTNTSFDVSRRWVYSILLRNQSLQFFVP